MRAYLTKTTGYALASLSRILALVDAKVGLKTADEMLFTYLSELKKPFIVVLTKADKVSSAQLQRTMKEVGSRVGQEWAASPLVFATSAVAQYGLTELRAYLAYMIQERTAPTS